MEFNAVETTISLDSFAKLVKNIPECADYNMDRIEDWLNCDEAEPKRGERSSGKVDDPEENIIFVDVQNSATAPEISSVPTVEDADDNESEEESEEIEATSNDIYLDDNGGDVTCKHKEALDALNILLKYMKNDADSRYKDVILLTDIKKKIKQKLTQQPIKKEMRDFS